MKSKRILSLLCLASMPLFANDYMVTSLDDSGPGTLREALEMIEAEDTITFDELTGTITLASALPAITVDATITGPTMGSVTIDGDSAYSIFDVSGFTFISNLTLENPDPATAGSAILAGEFSIVVLDNMTLPHCETFCEAPVKIAENGTLMTNNVLFSTSGTGGVDVLFEEATAGIFSCDTTQPEIWIGSTGTASLYKEGSGTMDLKASSSVDISLITDEGTLTFSDTTTEPIYALSNGIFQGTPTTYYVANMGVVTTGVNFGTITNTLDYYQTNGGVLNTKIDPSGSCDLVQMAGTAYLDGDLIIPLQDGEYVASTNYTLMTYENGYSMPFDNVYFDVPGVGLQPLTNASLNYNMASLDLEITSNFTIGALRAAEKDKRHHGKKKEKPSEISNMFTKIVEKHKRPHKKEVVKTMKQFAKELHKKCGPKK